VNIIWFILFPLSTHRISLGGGISESKWMGKKNQDMGFLDSVDVVLACEKIFHEPILDVAALDHRCLE
jgi:hypothetical protein